MDDDTEDRESGVGSVSPDPLALGEGGDRVGGGGGGGGLFRESSVDSYAEYSSADELLEPLTPATCNNTNLLAEVRYQFLKNNVIPTLNHVYLITIIFPVGFQKFLVKQAAPIILPPLDKLALQFYNKMVWI